MKVVRFYMAKSHRVVLLFLVRCRLKMVHILSTARLLLRKRMPKPVRKRQLMNYYGQIKHNLKFCIICVILASFAQFLYYLCDFCIVFHNSCIICTIFVFFFWKNINLYYNYTYSASESRVRTIGEIPKSEAFVLSHHLTLYFVAKPRQR